MNKIIITILAIVLLSVNLASAKEVIDMKKESGVYTIPCEVNDLKLRFIFDTGASSVSISLTEASFMLKNGYLDEEDIIGSTDVYVANGDIEENYIVNIKKLKIGSITLTNVQAVVSNGLNAPLLLGQTVLDKLGHWSFYNSQLILNDYDQGTNSGNYSIEQIKEMLNSSDKDFAFDYLRSLVRGGDNDAAMLFLDCYDKITGYTQKSNDRLLDNDVVIAMQVLANLSDNDENDVTTHYLKLIEFCLYDLGDTAKAIQYLKQCEDASVLCQDNYDYLAERIMLECGWGDDKYIDPNFAEYCYVHKHYEAYTSYASYLKDEKNQHEKAVQAYKRVSDAGYLPASTQLGICYLKGVGTLKNTTQGLALLNKAADGGDFDAIEELCERYYFGDGVKTDYDKVIKYAELFGDQGAGKYRNCAFQGIAYYQTQQYKTAMFYLAKLNYLDELKDGLVHANKDFYNAYQFGLRRINSAILLILGDCYEHGRGTQMDLDLATTCYLKLVDSNPSLGYASLGDMLFINELVKSEPEQAYQCYLLGANNGSSYCAFRLALMNYYGVGTNENHIKAAEYKKQAIASGDFSSSDFQF
jgi:clan AA aspartic protease (TIGR02281 family)